MDDFTPPNQEGSTDESSSGAAKTDQSPPEKDVKAAPVEVDVPGFGKVSLADLQAWKQSHARSSEWNDVQAEKIRIEHEKKLIERTLQSMAADPEEYNRFRAKMGYTEPVRQDRTIDPIANEERWIAARVDQYRQRGITDDTQLQSLVYQDLALAQNKRILEEMKGIKQQVEEARLTAQETRDAAEVERTLEGIYSRYPQADTEDGRELVEALMARRAATLSSNDEITSADLEAMVKRVAGLNQAAISSYVAGKKSAARTTAAVGRGGNVKAPSNPADKLPASTDSFFEIAQMIAKGDLPIE